MQTLWLFVWTYSLGSEKEVKTRSNLSFIISPLWNHMARVENFPFWLKLVLLLLFKMQIVFLKQRRFSNNLPCKFFLKKNQQQKKLRLKMIEISVWRRKQPQYNISSIYVGFVICMYVPLVISDIFTCWYGCWWKFAMNQHLELQIKNI